MDKFYHYNKNLKQYSKQLRNNSTFAEVILWNEVLKGRKLGYQFHRQRAILNYIGDFFCKELKLVIETDGVTHLDEVVEDLEGVRERIKVWIKDYENKYPEVIKIKGRNKRS